MPSISHPLRRHPPLSDRSSNTKLKTRNKTHTSRPAANLARRAHVELIITTRSSFGSPVPRAALRLTRTVLVIAILRFRLGLALRLHTAHRTPHTAVHRSLGAWRILLGAGGCVLHFGCWILEFGFWKLAFAFCIELITFVVTPRHSSGSLLCKRERRFVLTFALGV